MCVSKGILTMCRSSTVQFPSNWELSATRAVTVVRTLSEQYGVPSENLSAVGYADSRPRTDNLIPEHRAQNRRVEIVVLERKQAPYPLEQEEERTALQLFANPPVGSDGVVPKDPPSTPPPSSLPRQ